MTQPAGEDAPGLSGGLSSDDAAARLRTQGANAIPEHRRHPVVLFLARLSGPVPWMLEAALVLQLVLGRWVEASILVGLLLFNATISFSHARHARGALDLLQAKLQIVARVCRDGVWSRISAADLVPGDLVHVRVGTSSRPISA